jgi:tRNA (guanosine-2'-O-)-methyltransferase
VTRAIDRLLARHRPDDIVAAVRPLLSERRIERIERVLDARLGSVTAVLENLHDPHNGAAVIRSVEALGVQRLHVVETVEKFPFSPAITIGCEKWIEIRRHRRLADALDALREVGFAVFAAAPDAELTVETVPVDRPLAIIFGNEHAGLTDDALRHSDARVRIPMHGFTQSFNLSVSVAVTLGRVTARRRAHIERAGDLDGRERAHLRARWYADGVRGVEGILERYVSEQTRAGVSGDPRPHETGP